jgi:UDP-glucose 4-epimerase
MSVHLSLDEKSVLITGGLGFIGSALSRYFSDNFWDVTVLDSRLNYRQIPDDEFLPMQNFREQSLLDQVRFHSVDLVDLKQLQSTLDSCSFSTVIHLAGHPLAGVIGNDRSLGLEQILIPTENLLGCLVQRNPKRFVYVSSSMVYGHFLSDKVAESSELFPVNVYGQFKKNCEEKVQEHCQAHGIEFSIVRPSAVYGIGDSNNRILYRLIKAAATAKRMQIFSLHERLDFTSVEDLVRGLFLVTTKPEAKNEVFNLTYGESRTLGEAIEIITKELAKPEFDLAPNPSKNPIRGTLSIQKARNLLGYEPQVSLEAGLARYISDLERVCLSQWRS